jgi:aspartyl-tRNA(Asn)/glutamyl-tRNA(Gln) amidotransferase subunit A
MYTAHEVVRLVSSKEKKAVDIAQEYLMRIEEKNKDLNAYLEVYADVLEQAQNVDARIEAGEKLSLAGVCIGLKDNILRDGCRASAGSKILETYTAPYSSTVVQNLQKAGAIFLGRLNMDEFAMGGSTENSAYGLTKNPHDLTRVPGGSSGGSAAALAADLATLTLGSDTGGSIRQPASLCGVVGLMPTYGTVSRYGVVAMGSSLDQIGPFAHNIKDLQLVYSVLAEYDRHDSTCVPQEKRVMTGVKNKKIGVPFSFVEREGVDPEVLANFKTSLEDLKSKGYEIVPIDLPLAHYSLAVYYIIMPAEASTNLARFDGVRFGLSLPGATPNETFVNSRGKGFGKEVQRRIMLGSYVLSHGYYDAFYKKAVALRAAIIKDFKKAFEEVEFIATPTSPIPAFTFGEKSDPLSMYLADIFTVPVNIAQIPAISVPSGKTKNNLPLGIQFMAAQFNESGLFEIGDTFENHG